MEHEITDAASNMPQLQQKHQTNNTNTKRGFRMSNLWLAVDVENLCTQHLLGLHSECHLEVGTVENHPHGEAIVRGHWVFGQVSMEKVGARHQEVVEEMERRGLNHDSPLEYRDTTGFHSWMHGLPMEQVQKAMLSLRCKECDV